MIKETVFTLEWLQKFRNDPKFKKINPPVFEKMIYALLLLEKLSESNINFIFKGGTSLVLLLDEADRFSVDIDIMTTHTKEEIEETLNSIINKSSFTKYEYDERRSTTTSIPKAHYKIYYNSEYYENAYVLLDVLFEDNYYPSVLHIPINCVWIETEEPISKVKIPCVNSILGDKLTAFAPNTTGIPYAKEKQIEIIKQLHDVGKLIDHADNIAIVKESFEQVATTQIHYRRLDININTIYDDILNTALLIARRDNNKGEDKKKMDEIQQGLTGFTNYLMFGSFRIEDAIIASSKAALLAVKLKHNNLDSFDLFQNQDLSKLEIKNQGFNFINRFKKTIKPAFYYWYQTLKIIGIE